MKSAEVCTAHTSQAVGLWMPLLECPAAAAAPGPVTRALQGPHCDHSPRLPSASSAAAQNWINSAREALAHCHWGLGLMRTGTGVAHCLPQINPAAAPPPLMVVELGWFWKSEPRGGGVERILELPSSQKPPHCGRVAQPPWGFATTGARFEVGRAKKKKTAQRN